MEIYYPETLPIHNKREEILSAIQEHQIVIIAGETGSGKTTQLPKMCLEILPDSTKKIGCTQPRRVAALTVAQRVSEELGDLGHLVGSKIRFQDKTDRDTRIKFMTDGILLAETRHDKQLKAYDVLIIDEAHERSLNIDFLIGFVKKIITQRKDLKVIITSATIDTELFSRHFSSAPIIEIPGKTFPVEVRYLPAQENEYGDMDNYVEQSVDAARRVYMQEPPGDMLVFLPTEKDIRRCCELLEKQLDGVLILPLFGRLHPNDQKKIFSQVQKTKIVVATNVAETSITVPGIRYVIDCGLARMSYYNHRSKTNSLPVRKISKASCDQRKGRCGRVGPGVCLRLFDEEEYNQRDEFTLPEIKRSNLAEVILQMESFGLGDPYSFPFLEPPHPTAIREGYTTLMELGALDERRKLTKIGKQMAALPMDPKISRIIIEAATNNCLKEILVISSVLSIQDPRIRPGDQEKKADEAHEIFAHPQSDFLTLLNIWQKFHEENRTFSWSSLRKFCKTNFLSFLRMREWLDLHEQIKKIVKKGENFQINVKEAGYEAIHTSLAIGFLRTIGCKKDKKLYQGPSGKEVMIFPGSAQFKKSPQWFLASSFLETNRLYALNVAAIEPEWLEKVAGNLCRLSWSSPNYNKKSGKVNASERVSLFGLIIIGSRQVDYGRTNEKNRRESRQIFIQKALVEGQLHAHKYPFLRHNEKLLKKWEDVESRLRVRDILVNDQIIHEFYDEMLHQSVYDRSSLNRSLKKGSDKRLYLTEEYVVQRKPPGNELADFPHTLNSGSHSFPLTYSFEPGSEMDGVSVRIPHELIESINPLIFEWVVPGLLREKIAYLLKSLPKKIRKHLIPLNTTVDKMLDDIILYRGSLYKALEDSIFKQFSLTIKRSDWTNTIPEHLQLRICLIDTHGKIIECSRDISKLSGDNIKQGPTTPPRLAVDQKKMIERWEKSFTQVWAFDSLPDKVTLNSPRGEVTGYLYPALKVIPEKSGVSISFHNKKDEAQLRNRKGIRYLYRLQYSQQYKSLKKQCSTSLSGPSSLWLINLFPSKADAVEAILNFILDSLFNNFEGEIPSQEEFKASLENVPKANFFEKGTTVGSEIMSLLRSRAETLNEISRYEGLSKKSKSHNEPTYREYQRLLNDIVPSEFLANIRHDEIEDAKRYLHSLAIRVARAHTDVSKDKKKEATLAPHSNRLVELKQRKESPSEDCFVLMKEYESLLNEFRISLFSPEIRTKFPVSEKKIKKLWQEILKVC